jgi:tripartite-type tricarboxylate transporter receptor subunit TctC
MAVGSGEVALGFFNTPLVVSLIKSGKLRGIAVTSAARSPLLPDVPTMQEQGMKDYVFTSWSSFAVPKGTPPEIVARLNAECLRIAQLPAFREKMSAQGIDMLPPTTPAEAGKLLRDDLALWGPIIKAAGAAAE